MTLPSLTRAPVTLILVALNVLIGFYTLSAHPDLIEQYMLVPSRAGSEPITLVTNVFLHASFHHLLFNMLALLAFSVLEEEVGSICFLLIYAAGAAGGDAFVMLFSNPDQGTLGASGAIFGVMASALIVGNARANIPGVLSALVLSLIVTFTVPNISWEAHVGGGLGGLVAAAVLYLPARYHYRRLQEAQET